MRLRFLAAASLACLLLLQLAASVLGHAQLVESDPADGKSITTPYTIAATFSQEFDANPQRSFMTVIDADELEIARGQVSPDDPTVMTVEVPELEPGEYTVRWQTTTADDNGVERGTFTFTVAPPPPSAGPSSTPATGTPGPGEPGGGGDEGQSEGPDQLLLALVIAAVAIVAIATFVFARTRR